MRRPSSWRWAAWWASSTVPTGRWPPEMSLPGCWNLKTACSSLVTIHFHTTCSNILLYLLIHLSYFTNQATFSGWMMCFCSWECIYCIMLKGGKKKWTSQSFTFSFLEHRAGGGATPEEIHGFYYWTSKTQWRCSQWVTACRESLGFAWDFSRCSSDSAHKRAGE